jgi:hypothetical protein
MLLSRSSTSFLVAAAAVPATAAWNQAAFPAVCHRLLACPAVCLLLAAFLAAFLAVSQAACLGVSPVVSQACLQPPLLRLAACQCLPSSNQPS